MINMIDDDSKRCYIRSKCFPSMKTGKYSHCPRAMVVDDKGESNHYLKGTLYMSSWVIIIICVSTLLSELTYYNSLMQYYEFIIW